MPFDVSNIFSRIWKFVDHFAEGDDITRSDLDVALDDLAGGLNTQSTRIGLLTTTVSTAAADAATAAVADGLADATAAATSAETAAEAAAISAANAEAQVLATAAQMLEWKGPWGSGVNYNPADLVSESGNVYICPTGAAHTSGTFATDLAAGKWQLFASKGSAGTGTGDMLNSDNLSGLTSKAAARTNLGLGSTALQNFMPVEQGGGAGQSTNKLRFGYHTSGYGLKVQVDVTDLGFLMVNPQAGGWDATRIYAPGAAPNYTVRSWGKILGSGGIAAGGNISSVTKLGTGSYRINFLTAMPDANYVVLNNGVSPVNLTTSSFQINYGTDTDFRFIVVR